jgi:hypothetical protein
VVTKNEENFSDSPIIIKLPKNNENISPLRREQMTPSERMKNDMKAAKIKSFKRQVTQDMTKTAK